MKRKFEGNVSASLPPDWDALTGKSPFMEGKVLKTLETCGNTRFKYVVHDKYVCCEYSMKLNLFTYGKLHLNLPFTVIGLPVSVSSQGFTGDYREMIADYMNRGGMFLILNMADEPPAVEGVTSGQTLATCLFENRYESFSHYLSSLRSSYRRRVKEALHRGEKLRIRSIESEDFTDEMHSLYLNVLKRSAYPLETLPAEFFRVCQGSVRGFFLGNKPASFVLTRQIGDTLYFVFGGMDYSLRDEYDLYYNMLLEIIRQGTEAGVRYIDFGQTAESTKLRLGCRLSERYMSVFSRYKTVNALFKRFGSLLEYKKPESTYHCFRDRFEGNN